MELELKHLAGYLPYGLKILVCGDEREMTIEDEMDSQTICLRDANENKHKPILYPLSSLTKDIEVNGKKFVPIDVLNKMLFTKHSKLEYYNSEFCNGAILFSTNIEGFNILSMNEKIQKLYEWHFDIHGLIEKGLAISKHDI